MTVWKLATNVEYRTLSSLFGLGRSTVGKIVIETCHAITIHLLPQYVQIPRGQKLREIVDGFETFWGFPQAAGAIDGSHIPIIRPDESASDYYNRKGYYSIIVQAVVDHLGLFMDVYIGWPGKVHDARVFANSSLYHRGSVSTLFPDWKKTISGVEVCYYTLSLSLSTFRSLLSPPPLLPLFPPPFFSPSPSSSLCPASLPPYPSPYSVSPPLSSLFPSLSLLYLPLLLPPLFLPLPLFLSHFPLSTFRSLALFCLPLFSPSIVLPLSSFLSLPSLLLSLPSFLSLPRFSPSLSFPLLCVSPSLSPSHSLLSPPLSLTLLSLITYCRE